MPHKSSWNPIAFVPPQVTLLSFAVYAALFSSLLWVHHVVPPAPTDSTPADGVNLTTAWLDLEHLTDGFHPYNSRRNGEIRTWLVERVEGILRENGLDLGSQDAVVWNGGSDNVTYANKWLASSPTVRYTEDENIVVYIRGEQDEEGAWWEDTKKAYNGAGGVLVNAHYDSVSTGYGATDDGVGVATVLQLISHYTSPGNKPKRGVIALLNNGEEDGLYGAQVYTKHVTSKFPRVFLNLEGAGAGGRAMLFRSSDAEVTRFYSRSRYPFGTVISGDGFKRGFVRSGTDYSVFEEELGLRGLDVAFMAPRSRYHTNQDDARDTSPDSVWHMLSAALDTTKAMTSHSGNEFSGSSDDGIHRANSDRASNGVWFDIFGRTFAVLKLHDLFALSVTLLVAAPVLLIILEAIIAKLDKWYPFTRRQYLHSSDDDEPVYFNGLRGFFRFPIVFSVATACVVALAFLMTKINPYILYSSEYAVWTMMLAAWFSIAWFLSTMADKVRPTALSRMYTLLWMYVVSWIILVFVTIGENNLKIASGYFMVIYNASVFAALLISYLELLALPKKTKYVEHVAGAASPRSTRPGSVSSRRLLDETEDQPRSVEGDNEEATERTGLLRGGERRNRNTFARFGGTRNQDVNDPLDESEDPFLAQAYGFEQAWSGSLPQWTWILQFLILAPINIILVGQIALFITSALHQTPADGNAVLPIYLMMAALSVLILLPLAPFLHRFTFHLPTFFFFIFVGCLIYNLLAFPFSRDARLKHYFIQNVDLDNGNNTVQLTGAEGYLQTIVDQLPSVAGQPLNCSSADDPRRAGLQTCRWEGLAPNILVSTKDSTPLQTHAADYYKDWVKYNVTNSGKSALLTFSGKETKNCRLLFDSPVSSLHITNTTDIIQNNSKPARRDDGSGKGTTELRLFSRSWDKEFQVNVTWADGEAKGKSGKVGCMWSDVNERGVVPALDEVWRFEPVWSVVSKGSDGLVEGWRNWQV
ncbi:hypothetical protein Q7P37_004728 [Cladosporium fusiforme]